MFSYFRSFFNYNNTDEYKNLSDEEAFKIEFKDMPIND